MEPPPSLREPQLEPSTECWTILVDHGPAMGGWGPAAVMIPGVSIQPQPIIYTGSDPTSLEGLKTIARELAQRSGKPTRLVRFTEREDVFVVGGSS